jgi:cysteine desulfurase / selenocysteine lyase
MPLLPDEATLTRLANEFFSALPGQQAAAVVPGQQPSAAWLDYQPAAVADGLAAVAPQPPGTAFTLPAIGPPATPSFYFVDEFPAAAQSAPTFLPDAQPASNVYRGAHALAARATDAYEGARATVADFLGATSSETVIFTRGATEAINMVAQAWGRQYAGVGDEIVISHLEHHANIVPWQQLADQVGAKLKVIPVDDDGQLLLDAYQDLLTDRTRLVAVTHVSNVLGTVVPVREVIDAAHRAGAKVLIDGAQAIAHIPVDVTALDADFYAFSGHKAFGPLGIGALYGKPELLEAMPPWHGGGNMIQDVTLERTTYAQPPTRFEAGTGSIADAVGLGAALAYVRRIGLASIGRYEHGLLEYATSEIGCVPGLRLVGTAPEKASVLTFVLDGYQPTDVAAALDKEGIAVRAGHHCAQPILRRYGLESAVRPSLAMYNTVGEVDLLVAALRRLAADAGRRR